MYVKISERETYFTVEFDKDQLAGRVHEFIRALPKDQRKWNYASYSWTVDIQHLRSVKALAYPFTDKEEEDGELQFKEFMYQFEDPL